MSVFTPVTPDALDQWLSNYAIGHLIELRGISEGVQNSNFFVTTSLGRYVLTLFETLSHAELPFYLHLMAHLARHGLPVPVPDRTNSAAATITRNTIPNAGAPRNHWYSTTIRGRLPSSGGIQLTCPACLSTASRNGNIARSDAATAPDHHSIALLNFLCNNRIRKWTATIVAR